MTPSQNKPMCAEAPDTRVVGRFAPSPSGRMHLGNVFAALLAWLSARSQNGQVLLRIEDLDPRCSSPEKAEQILDDLRWLGLDWDGPVVYQHERTDLYAHALGRLEDLELVYPCFCSRADLHAAGAPHASDGTPVYAGTCRNLTALEVLRRMADRPAAVRLRVPEQDDPAGTVAFADRVYGKCCENLSLECGDFLVRRSDGVFAYQLAVVVDDAEMGVTEVVRGHDLLSSVPRQIYLQRLLGYPQPAYAHVPLLLSPTGARLSKRDRSCDLGELRQVFGTPENLVGRLAHVAGITPDSAPRSAEQLVDLFSWDCIEAHKDDLVIDDEFFG